jgi:hypothetical protein
MKRHRTIRHREKRCARSEDPFPRGFHAVFLMLDRTLTVRNRFNKTILPDRKSGLFSPKLKKAGIFRRLDL